MDQSRRSSLASLGRTSDHSALLGSDAFASRAPSPLRRICPSTVAQGNKNIRTRSGWPLCCWSGSPRLVLRLLFLPSSLALAFSWFPPRPCLFPSASLPGTARRAAAKALPGAHQGQDDQGRPAEGGRRNKRENIIKKSALVRSSTTLRLLRYESLSPDPESSPAAEPASCLRWSSRATPINRAPLNSCSLRTIS